ncbi:hypothetical protein [Stappia sp. ES.058]|uniref:hypothetical protein n=1 Tax=Stappia sp. ES.058 TaxID=1881061 RepID=UPI00087A5C3B|nr:hypothetical protein [Stappia sp. ES.058]SDU36002.1 hypothetical protein SAMN05428979_3217 [Stappia sp. ES.058]
MKKTILAAVAAGLLMTAPAANALDARAPSFAPSAPLSATADAGQVIKVGQRIRRHRDRRLGPRRIVRKLHRRGFRNVSRVRARGDIYIVRANGRRGAPLRLVVDAYSGKVVGRTVLRGPGRGRGGHRWGGRRDHRGGDFTWGFWGRF